MKNRAVILLVLVLTSSAKAKFYNGLKSIPTMFRMNRWEFAKWSYLMLKTWTSNNRSKIKYDKLNAAQAWKPLLKETGICCRFALAIL